MTKIPLGTPLPRLDAPQPQPLPGHDDDDGTTATVPAGPQPRNTIGAVGIAAAYALPVLAVGAAMAGANRSVAGAVAGFGVAFGGMALGISATGPKGGPSPGSVHFDELAHNPAFSVPVALAAPVGGGIAALVVAAQPSTYDYNTSAYKQPKDWAPAKFAVGALWGGLAGVAAGGLAWGGTAVLDVARDN